MYFLKFGKWFWKQHLKNDEARTFFVMQSIGVGAVPAVLLTYFFGPVALGWYFGSILAILVAFLIYYFFSAIYRAYVKWQEQVFDKLRGENNAPDSRW